MVAPRSVRRSAVAVAALTVAYVAVPGVGRPWQWPARSSTFRRTGTTPTPVRRRTRSRRSRTRSNSGARPLVSGGGQSCVPPPADLYYASAPIDSAPAVAAFALPTTGGSPGPACTCSHWQSATR
jgi:hypothetical protein